MSYYDRAAFLFDLEQAADARARQLRADATSPSERFYAADFALQDVATELAGELLAIAMDIAHAGYVLGSADGDGRGGFWLSKLEGEVERILGPARPPAPRAPSDPRRRRTAISATKRGRVLQRDGDQCKHCGATDDLSIDHIVPVVKGGTNDLDNLQVLCRSCNSSKGAR